METALFETLRDLGATGSMTTTAVRLRITQSAVSKRVAALEAAVGVGLVEPSGRKVRLTPAAETLLARVSPLVTGIDDAVREARDAHASCAAAAPVAVGVSESVLASFGAESIAAAARAAGVSVALHAHRSPVAIDHVRSGRYDLAVVAGESDAAAGLSHRAWIEEEMVIVPRSGEPGGRLRAGAGIDVWTIEESSATWRTLARRLPHLRRTGCVTVRPVARLESFGALVAAARAGFGAALVPAGTARAAGLRAQDVLRLPAPGLSRPVGVVARKTALARRGVAALAQRLACAPAPAGSRMP